MQKAFSLMIFVFALFLIVSYAYAADFCVSTATEFQSALDVAEGNGEDDVIQIVQGTYEGNFVYSSYAANSLKIKGGYDSGCAAQTLDPANTILDGGEIDNVLALVVYDELAADFSVEGLTVQNGGIYIRTAGDLVYSNNNQLSGSFEVKNRNINLNNSSFSNSACNITAHENISEICNIFDDSSVIIAASNSYLYDNIFQNYDGIIMYSLNILSNSVYFLKNIFRNNKHISIITGDKLVLKSNEFLNNTNTYSGPGGISYKFMAGALLVQCNISCIVDSNIFLGNISKCTFCSNASGCITVGFGGALNIYGQSETAYAILKNNVISSNKSFAFGGGIYSNVKTNLINNTISNNIATHSGGGIYLIIRTENYPYPEIYNNIIQNNVAEQGADIYINNIDNTDPYFPVIYPVEIFYNDFDQSAEGFYAESPIDIDPSNLDNVDPLFVDPENGDYRLSADSPCINVGDNNAPGLPKTDIVGNARVFDGIVDLGAYEYGSSPVAKSTPKPVYQFYSPGLQAHFWTIDEAEANNLKKNGTAYWTYEFIAWYAYDEDDYPEGSKPVYRFWLQGLGEHFYTMDEAEKDYIIANYPASFQTFEGIAYYAYPKETKPADSIPVYRLWLGFLGSHHFTINAGEKDSLVANYPTARYEGIAWYVLKE